MIRKFAAAGLASYASAAVMLLQAMVLSRALGPEGVGSLTLVRQTVLIAVQVACLGLPISMITLVNRGEQPLARAFHSVRAFTLVTGLTMGAAVWVWSTMHTQAIPDGATHLRVALFVWVVLFVLETVYFNYLTLKLFVFRGLVVSLCVPVISLVLYVVLWWQGSLTVASAILNESLVMGVGRCVAAWWMARPFLREDLTSQPGSDPSIARNGFWRYIGRGTYLGLPMIAADVAGSLSGYILLCMLEWSCPSPAEIGFFSRGLRLATITMIAVQGLQRLLLARWSQLKGDEQVRHLERSMNLMITVVVLLGAVTTLLAQPLTVFLFGREFLPATNVTRITVIAVGVYTAGRMLASFLNANHRQYANCVVQACGLLVSFVVGLLLIPKWKADGAAIAIAASYAVMTTALFGVAIPSYGLRWRSAVVPSPSLIRYVLRRGLPKINPR